MPHVTEQDDSPVTGHAVIQGYLKTLDGSPGVYRMLDAQSRVLYVGKARNLQARVSNYARPTGHSPRIARMICETASMMFLTTATETEALLLEQNLIKQLKPQVQRAAARRQKLSQYPGDQAIMTYPQIKKHRGAKKEKGAYYGPFASAGAVNRTLNQLQRVFLLRNCSDAMFESRTRPCLQYQIKRCSAPCVGKISQGRIWRDGARCRALSVGQIHRHSGKAGGGRWPRPPRRWSLSAPLPCATGSRR